MTKIIHVIIMEGRASPTNGIVGSNRFLTHVVEQKQTKHNNTIKLVIDFHKLNQYFITG